MHGDDLPNVLSVVSIALTLVVILYARGTVREAKRTTAEEQATVRELTKLLAAVGELAASSERSLKAAERTAKLAERTAEILADTRYRETRKSYISQLRSMLRTVRQIQSDAAKQSAAKWVGGDKNTWRCAQQSDLEAALKGVKDARLPLCGALAQARGIDIVLTAAANAGVELQKELRAMSVIPEE